MTLSEELTFDYWEFPQLDSSNSSHNWYNSHNKMKKTTLNCTSPNTFCPSNIESSMNFIIDQFNHMLPDEKEHLSHNGMQIEKRHKNRQMSGF